MFCGVILDEISKHRIIVIGGADIARISTVINNADLNHCL